MPLKKGYSDKTISRQQSFLRRNHPLMNNVFKMSNRMAGRAEHLQIGHLVVGWMSIHMMNPEDAWNFIVAALLARIHQSSAKHLSSHRGKFWIKGTDAFFVDAVSGTKFPLLGRGAKKFLFAVKTFFYDSSFQTHRFVITFSGTILRFVGSRVKYGGFLFARLTDYFRSPYELCGSAFDRTVFGGEKSIPRDVEFFTTPLAFDVFTRGGL